MKLVLKLFLFFLLSVKVILSEELKNASYVRAIYELVKAQESQIFDKYSLEIFKPLNGPFYQHLSLSSDPRSRHLAENGFSEEKWYDEEIALYPPIREEQVILIDKKKNWRMEKDIDMVDFMEALLELYVLDNDFILEDEEILYESSENLTIPEASDRLVLAEFQRPRIFLAFFVDVYRILLDLSAACKAEYKSQPDHCADFFTSYDHVLATYTELICKYMTAFGPYDIDHICPNLCLPRGDPLWHPTDYYQKSIDVCGQIPFAVPGTCRLFGKGIYDHEFVCECVTSAYQWNTDPGQMVLNQHPRCEPKDTDFEKLAPGTSENFNCTRAEFEHFCNIDGSTGCTFKKSRERLYGRNVTITKTSLWPKCICKDGYAGLTCDRRINICEDPLQINEKEQEELEKKIPGLPKVITGNWLCEGYMKDANCLPDYSNQSKYKYRCECKEGYKRDLNYGDLDNCRLRWKSQDDYIDRFTACPPGYAGDDCDRTINAWSKWSEWSECYPVCGSHRQRRKRRLCLGDFGCVGSTYETKKCVPYPCTKLRESKRNKRKPLYKMQYIENGGLYILPLNETIVTMVFITLFIQIGVLILFIYIFWKKEGEKARRSQKEKY